MRPIPHHQDRPTPQVTRAQAKSEVMPTVPEPAEERLMPFGLAIAAEWLDLSDERASWLQRVLDAERDGFARGAASRDGEYERGFGDGILAYKVAQHDLHRLIQSEMIRWGGWREDFGKPRPGDFPGRSEAA